MKFISFLSYLKVQNIEYRIRKAIKNNAIKYKDKIQNAKKMQKRNKKETNY